MRALRLKTLVANQSGAATVDWVVLSGALVLISGLIIAQIKGGIDRKTRFITHCLENDLIHAPSHEVAVMWCNDDIL